MSRIKKVAILTNGGDCPGLNAVIRAVVHTAVSGLGAKVLGVLDGFSGLIEDRIRPLKLSGVSGILPRGGTILGTSNRDNPYRYPLRDSTGKTTFEDRSATAVKTLRSRRVDALIAVGGDGTQAIASRLYTEHQVPVVGIPKTIDNDLDGTDITFGFDTALNIATDAIDILHSTAESHHRTMIIEVMGRYAGWIALESGLAGGGDVILIPEIPFTMEKVVEKIQRRQRQGKRFSLVVVAEGAREKGRKLVVKRKVSDPNDPKRLGGISRAIGARIEEMTGIETRYTILGHLQRGGSPTPFDRILASRFGYHSVMAAERGEFGHMVGLRGTEIRTTPLAEAIASPRRVRPDSDLIRTARAVGTSFGDPD